MLRGWWECSDSLLWMQSNGRLPVVTVPFQRRDGNKMRTEKKRRKEYHTCQKQWEEQQEIKEGRDEEAEGNMLADRTVDELVALSTSTLVSFVQYTTSCCKCLSTVAECWCGPSRSTSSHPKIPQWKTFCCIQLSFVRFFEFELSQCIFLKLLFQKCLDLDRGLFLSWTQAILNTVGANSARNSDQKMKQRKAELTRMK